MQKIDLATYPSGNEHNFKEKENKRPGLKPQGILRFLTDYVL